MEVARFFIIIKFIKTGHQWIESLPKWILINMDLCWPIKYFKYPITLCLWLLRLYRLMHVMLHLALQLYILNVADIELRGWWVEMLTCLTEMERVKGGYQSVRPPISVLPLWVREIFTFKSVCYQKDALSEPMLAYNNRWMWCLYYFY